MITHICGAGMAFLGFSLSLIIGLWVGNPFITVLGRAIVVLFCFYILGFILAALGQKVIVQNFQEEAERVEAPIRQSNETEPEKTDKTRPSQGEQPAHSAAESVPAG